MLNIHEQLEYFLRLSKKHNIHFSESKFIEMCGEQGIFYTTIRCDRIWEKFEILKARGVI